MLKLGALLTDAELAPDPVVEHVLCSDGCNACIKSCPSGALTARAVDQKKCRSNSEGVTKKGASITVCYTCRKICPNRSGWRTR